MASVVYVGDASVRLLKSTVQWEQKAITGEAVAIKRVSSEE
jgi:hypothetical protein